jgi:hypothetical protein
MITEKAKNGTLWTTDWDAIPIPTVSPSPGPEAFDTTPSKRSVASRFDVEPLSVTLNKRLKTEHSVTTNPLSDSNSDSEMEEPPRSVPQPVPKPKKKKKKHAPSVPSEPIADSQAEIERRDRRMQRFADDGRTTPSQVDTPDYIQDSQIAASLVYSNDNFERLIIDIFLA